MAGLGLGLGPSFRVRPLGLVGLGLVLGLWLGFRVGVSNPCWGATVALCCFCLQIYYGKKCKENSEEENKEERQP